MSVAQLMGLVRTLSVAAEGHFKSSLMRAGRPSIQICSGALSVNSKTTKIGVF